MKPSSLMGDSFKFTLYELFGYFLPGSVAVVALVIFDWSIAHAGLTEVPAWLFNVKALVLEGIGAYLLGHAMQALSNSILPDFGKAILHEPGCARDLLKRARQGLSPLLADLKDDVLIRVFEQEFQNRGPSPEREVYVYREGFYRGMLFPLILLAAALAVLAVRVPHLPLAVAHQLNQFEIAIAAVVAAVMASGMYKRAKRFCNYRILQALFTRILAIEEISAKEGGSSATKP